MRRIQEKTWGGWRIEMTRREKIGMWCAFTGIVCFGFGRAFNYHPLEGIGLAILFATAIVSGIAMGFGEFDK